MSSLSLYKDSKNPHVAIDVCLTRLYVFVDAVDVSEERLKNHMSALKKKMYPLLCLQKFLGVQTLSRSNKVHAVTLNKRYLYLMKTRHASCPFSDRQLSSPLLNTHIMII